MKRLEPEAAVRWIRNFLDKFDTKSLTIGGIIEALDLYIAQRFPEPCPYLVNGSPMTRESLLDMAAGYPLSKTVSDDEATAAIEVLTEQGFNVSFTLPSQS